MKTHIRSWSLRLIAASLALATIPVSADDAEGVVRLGQGNSTGIVRISDQAPGGPVFRGQSSTITPANCKEVCQSCPNGYEDGYAYEGGYDGGYATCPTDCEYPYLGCESPVCDWFRWNFFLCGMRKQQFCHSLKASCKADLHEKAAFLRCKFGYFCPAGNCGKGVMPIGCYNMVYPVDPTHFDRRDGQVYAAAGYNGPVAVPIAPVVNHTYNYGWGIPSSRLTPIARPLQSALTPGISVP